MEPLTGPDQQPSSFASAAPLCAAADGMDESGLYAVFD